MEKNLMIMARQSSVLFISFLQLALIISTCCRGELQKHGAAAPFFIFGDSFLDAGNNNYINTTTLDQANFWPYGETYFKFPSGRFSDGRLISDFIGEILQNHHHHHLFCVFLVCTFASKVHFG